MKPLFASVLISAAVSAMMITPASAAIAGMDLPILTFPGDATTSGTVSTQGCSAAPAPTQVCD